METQSRDLLENLLSNNFDLKNFRKFISELFKRDIGQHTPLNTEAQWIKNCSRLLSYKDCDVLVIETKKTVQQSRLYYREFIKHYLKQKTSKFALVAFYCTKENEWRLSLVEKLYESANEKIKENYTYYKRSSFLAGPQVGTHTIKSKLLPLLKEQNFNIEKLQDSFDIETVSEEFFDKYVELYRKIKAHIDKQMKRDEDLKNYFTSENIESDNLSKHLLGQIVFLYFIQKKGWFGVEKNKPWGTGDKNFLKEAFYKKYKNYRKSFFNEVLEPLFYDILSKKEEDDFRKTFNCRIPFLNGGLFEPYKNYKYKQFKLKLENDLFSNNETTKEGDEGTGILDVFDRYNFTVKEDEPLEKEVAIDPEMLGIIFEKLIPENERKKKGAFYTPREVVHYMCQESLIYCLLSEFEKQLTKEDIEKFIRYEYNSIDDLPEKINKNKKSIDNFLSSIAICDPAVGSGAFPVAMMLEIVNLRRFLNKNKEFNLYKAKLNCIEKSLYGVDNDEGSVEIAKLRFWLSLVVDEEKTENIRPLPNLSYKLMAGNSLLGEIKKDELFSPALEKQLRDLEKKKKLFFKEDNLHKKQVYKKDIDKILDIENPQHSYSTTFKKFLFNKYFSEIMKKGGFDIVITNPPYLRSEELTRLNYKPKLEHQGYQIYKSTMDIYGYFYEKSFELLKEKRISTFITSNKWLRSTYGESLRKFFEEKVTVNNVIDFKSNEIFSSATVDPNILSFQKQVAGGEYSIPFCDFSHSKFNQSTPIHNQIRIYKYVSEGEGKPWLLLTPIESSIKEKIERIGIPLKDWDIKVNFGIKTGCDEAFIIDTQTKDRLCKEHPSSKKIIKPILRGKDIKKWHYNQEKWLILAHNGDKNTIPIDIRKNYPAVWRYLQIINEETNGKLEKRCDKGFHWSNLRNCSYLKEFKKEKIIYPNMTKNVLFTYDKKNMYINQKGYIITGNSNLLKIIIGQLNSSLIRFFIKKTFSHLKGGTVELNKDKFQEISLLLIKSFEGTLFKKHICEIITITSSSGYLRNEIEIQKVKNLQKKIDQIIFDLYGLNQKEKDYITRSIGES